MQFILTGFTHETGFRVFAFDRIAEDRTRTRCTVRADLTLIRTYGIQIQDLPLLCRALLARDEDGATRSLTFTEDQMRACANERAIAREIAASRKKAPRRPTPSPSAGSAWRGLHT